MIRDLERQDVEACVELVRVNWGDEVADRFVDEISQAFNPNMRWPPLYFVCETDHQVVGFAGMIQSWQMHGLWDFIWINVHPDHQHRSIGLQLTTFRIGEVGRLGGRAINLMTTKPTFFDRIGFKITHMYDGGWCGMTLQLKELTL